MYSVRIATTHDRELPPPDPGLNIHWDRLTELIRREVSPQAAAIFAEPVRDDHGGETHWHVETGDDPRPIGELDDDERRSVLARLQQYRAAIAALAARLETRGDADSRFAATLRTIADVPDAAAHIWAAGGEPLLVAWGRRRQATAIPEASIVTRTKVAVPPPAAANTVTGTRQQAKIGAPVTPEVAVTPAGAAAVTQPPFDWLQALLWLLTALIAALIMYLLLAACAIDLPIVRSMFDRCALSSAASDTLDADRERHRALIDKVRTAQREVALKQSECVADGERRRVAEQNRSQIEQQQTVPTIEETEERLKQAHGSRGKLDLTLAWNGKEDLDLHVDCPEGHLDYSNRLICGASFELDRNANEAISESAPVEHIFWAGEPPPGKYKIQVELYNRFGLPPRPIPFTLIIRDGDKVSEHRGVAQDIRVRIPVTEFDR